MEHSGFALHDSNCSQKCASCGTLVCCETFQDLQKCSLPPMGREKGKSIRAKRRSSFDLDEQFENHDEFIEIIAFFMEQRDGHIFDPDAHSVRFRATLADCFVIENDASEASCAQNNDKNLQKRAIKCFRNDLFDCPGYYFHLRRCNERVDGPRFSLTCSCSNERRTGVRDPSSVQRHTTAKEFFDCHGELHISFSKSNLSATIIYDHKCHAETPKFRITEEIQQYIKAQQLFPPRQIYQNLIQLANSPHGEHRVSLAFTTPCFTDRANYNRAKMTEILIDSTFGTNRHGYELYCVLTEHDLVSLPLSYTRGVQERASGDLG
ncbi:hypothetical protein V1507DRAFT_482178 [Lipomyces tetrasporus]